MKRAFEKGVDIPANDMLKKQHIATLDPDLAEVQNDKIFATYN
jgi:hypothetical protein